MSKIICIKAPGFIGAILRFFCRRKRKSQEEKI